MNKRQLSADQLADADRLKNLWLAFKVRTGKTQDDVAEACGWKNQSAFSQYLNARIPLNLEAVLKLASVLEAQPEDISPSLARIVAIPIKPESNAELGGSLEAWDSETPLDEEDVELSFLKEIELAAGRGRTVAEDKSGKKLRFAR